MTADLSLLTTAAERWDAAAKDFAKVQQAYASQVQSIGTDGSWTGVANQFARPNMQQTHDQYTAAAKESRAVASLLRDAHAQFTDLRSKLKSAVADAEKQNMKIGDDGRVTYTMRDDPAARHDPDYQTQIAKIAEAERSWAHRIGELVQAFDDADQGVKLALTTAVRDADLFDGTGGKGFNGKAEGNLGKAEVAEATRLAQRIKSGKALDAGELAEAQWLFRDVAQDTKTSQTFLDSMGPDGTIELANKLNDLAQSKDRSQHQAYANLEASLAGTVSTATADIKSPFYDKWRDGLRRAGGKNFGSKTDPLYGYQSFVSLMEHHDRYGKQFLNDLGDDIITTEKKHPGIWTKWRTRPGIESDPLDHLLGVMSKNPDAATSFLDPGNDGKNDHLKYLLKDREWPKTALVGPAGLITQNDPSSKTGLATAIEAAATGHAPLAEGTAPNPEATHNAAQARVMHDTIELVDPGSSTAAPANLRRPLANALAEYSVDTHEILSLNSPKYSQHSGIDEVWEENSRTKMSVDPGKLLRTMRGLSEDPDAYATLHSAQSTYISDELNNISANAKDYDVKAPLYKHGAVLGALGAIREDVINDDRSAAYTAADWKAKVAYHIIGGVLTPAKIGVAPSELAVGDALQRGVDTWAWAWSNEMKSTADSIANTKISDNYMEANNQMSLMIQGWAGGHHISSEDTHGENRIEGMISDVQLGSVHGNGGAKSLLK
ncbi:hypothetical protein AB0A70_25325 [Streptomyces morookaense]|uniref:hypothetical protein n=1 Tax=Streptomyces morookaense TaxID=1970 RepID=UPI0033F0B40C